MNLLVIGGSVYEAFIKMFLTIRNLYAIEKR